MEADSMSFNTAKICIKVEADIVRYVGDVEVFLVDSLFPSINDSY